MSTRGKIRIGVLYGGRSGEHQISLQSAASVIHHLDRSKYEIIPIGIDQQGHWHLHDLSLLESSTKELPIFAQATTVLLPPNPSPDANGTDLISYSASTKITSSQTWPQVDVIFPIMHGPLCEDGSIQGLLELADLPYVGCGVLSSAISMDKDVAKRLLHAANIPVVPSISIKKSLWIQQFQTISNNILQQLGYPCFVKPANLGSSVGVHKAKTPQDLENALEDAFQYDQKVLIEKAISAREIEVALLENKNPTEPPLVSIAGEIIPHHEFYSYEAKYMDPHGASLQIPAQLTKEQHQEIVRLAQAAFMTLECEGMARIDFFLDQNSGKFYLNEVNTIPGFTSISMYPKLWEASGIPYSELLTNLIELAQARHLRKRSLVREFHYQKTSV